MSSSFTAACLLQEEAAACLYPAYFSAQGFSDRASLKPCPGKHRGLFAEQDYAAGDVILQENAFAWEVELEGGRALQTTHTEVPLKAFCLQMAPYHLDAAQAEQHKETYDLSQVLSSVMQHNAYSVVVGEEQSPARALFLTIALANHSCAPNAAISQVMPEDADAGHADNLLAFPRYRLQARQAIRKGEEICTSYVPRIHSRRKRQEELQTIWSFNCSCERCTQAGDDVFALKCPRCSAASSAAAAPLEKAIVEQRRAVLKSKAAGKKKTAAAAAEEAAAAVQGELDNALSSAGRMWFASKEGMACTDCGHCCKLEELPEAAAAVEDSAAMLSLLLLEPAAAGKAVLTGGKLSSRSSISSSGTEGVTSEEEALAKLETVPADQLFDRLLRHPLLSLCDARMWTVLNAINNRVDPHASKEAMALYQRVAVRLVMISMRTAFVSPHDLGIETEGEGAGEEEGKDAEGKASVVSSATGAPAAGGAGSA